MLVLSFHGLPICEVRYRYGTVLYLRWQQRTGKSISGQSALLCAKKRKALTETLQWTPHQTKAQCRRGAAQHLSDVLLPMDATPTLAAHVAPHAAFVSSISERADVVLASALFRELSQAFEKLSPLQLLALPLIVKARPGDVPASSRGRQRGVARRRRALRSCYCVPEAGFLRTHHSRTNCSRSLTTPSLTVDNDDAATFAASLYCVCLGLEWLGRTAYDERNGEWSQTRRQDTIGLRRGPDGVRIMCLRLRPRYWGRGLRADESGNQEKLRRRARDTASVRKSCVSWEAVIARAHVLAAEVKRVKSEVHTTTPGLKAAEARARVARAGRHASTI